jgi:hypothetical protein
MQRSNVLKILLVVLLYAAVSRPGEAKAWSQADTQESSRSAASLASSSRATANSPAAQVKAGTKISAELQSAVNARTAKPGDEVKARVTHDVKQDRRVAIHKGNMLLGHVVEAQAGAYKAGSRLAITFDKLVMGGSTTELHTLLTSVLSTPSEERQQREQMSQPMEGVGPASPGMRQRGAAGVGVGSTVSSAPDAAGTVARGVGSVADTAARDAARATTGTAVGASGGANLSTPVNDIHVQSGLHGEQMAGANSVLSTRQGDLRLESGSRLQFRVAAEAQGKAPGK